MDESLIRLGLRSQTWLGGIQLILVVIFGITLIAFLKSTYNRETFTCEPETSPINKQLCYDEYSSAMNPWFAPLYFVVLAYVVLFVFSISFMLYGAFTLRQIERGRKEQIDQSEKEDSFKRAYLLHVFCRLIFTAVIVGIFCGIQTLIVPKTYKCSVAAVATPTPFNQTETDLHCHDQHYREKSISNIAIIAIEVFIMILCIIEFIQVRRLTPPDLLIKLLREIFEDESNPLVVVPVIPPVEPETEDIQHLVVRRRQSLLDRPPPSPDSVPRGEELWGALKRVPVDKERVKSLLEACAPVDFREPGSQTGRTPLHFVVSEKNGDDELIAMLLTYGAETNLVDSFDLTPLHLAVEKGNLRAVQRLVINGADCNKRNRQNETPAEVAQRKQHGNVLNYLTSFQQAQERKKNIHV